MTPPPPGTIVRTAVQLARAWQRLMGQDGFDVATLWLIFFDGGGRLLRLIVPIDGIPPEPDALVARNLAAVVRELVASGEVASVALLISRPGSRAMTEADRRWARVLRAEMGELAVWPIHLATRGFVQVFAPDDLVAAS
jgi:hypothetical protein